MKKQLRILLSVTLAITLLISTISGVFAVAPKGPNGADLHWVGYNAGMAYYGDAQQVNTNFKFETDTANLYTGAGADSDGKALKVTAPVFQVFGAVLSLKADTYYQLSFQYKAPSVYNGAIFSNTGVIVSGGNWNGDGSAYLGNVERDKAFYNNDSGTKVSITTELLANKAVNTWYKTTISFYTGNKTTAYLTMRPLVDTVYLDAFDLTEVSALPGVAGFISNWTLYDNETTKIGTGGKLRDTAHYTLADSTEQVYTGEGADGDQKSLKLTGGFCQFITAKVTVEKNKRYALTGYYYTSALYGGSAISDAVIIKDGGAKYDDAISYMNRSAGSAYYYNASNKKITLPDAVVNSGVAANTWNKITMYFYSGELTEVLASFRMLTQQDVYLDGFTLTELTELPNDIGGISDWTLYDNETTKIGTGGKLRDTAQYTLADSTEQVYTGEGADSDQKSLKLTGGFCQLITAKVTVEKNKRYALTGYYYTSALYGGSAISDAVIIKDGGAKYDDAISYMNRSAGSAYYYNASNKKITLPDAVVNSGVAANTWNKITMYFYSGELTEVLASFRMLTQQDVYLDGFTLTEVTELPGDNVEPDISDGWVVYDFTTQKIGTGGKLRTTANVTATTEQVYTGADGDGDGKALKFNTDCYAQYVTKQVDLKANTYYEVTAYYYTTKVTANAVFSHVRMVKDGGANADVTTDNMGQIARDSDAYYYNKNGAKYSLTGERTTGAKPNQWNKVTLKFYSGNNTKGLLTFRPTVATDVVTYLDNIKITEVSTLPGADFVDTGWVIYDNTTTKLGTGGAIRSGASTNYDTSVVYTGTGADTDGKSFRFSGAYAQYLTKKFKFEANSYYTLTAYYYGTELDSSKGMLSHARVTKDGAIKADLSVDNLGAIDRDRAYYTNKNGVNVNVAGNTVTDVKANKWNKLTISFYSGSLTEALMVFRPTINGEFYIDGISLEKVSAFDGADRMPTGWTTYTMESQKIGTGGAIHPRASVDFSTKKVYTGAGADSDNQSYVFNNECFAQYVTRKIEFKANTYYNLSFYYYGTKLGGNDAILSDAFIVKDGADISVSSASADNLGFLSRTTAYYTNQHGLTISKYDAKLLSDADVESWNKVEIPFYSGNLTSALLAIRPVSPAENNPATGSDVFVDGITLTEEKESEFQFADMKPFEGWNGPQTEYIINFDDFYVPMDMTDRVQLTDAPKKDGKVTTAAHILQGAWPSSTVPNINAIGADKDPVFTLPVEENTTYSISYSLYITEGQPVLRYFAFYYDFFYTHIGNEDTTTLVRNSGMTERGEWVTFETFFTTKPGQKVISLAWNAGDFTVDMFIDDIILRKIQPGTIADASHTSYCEDFYNELIDLKILDDIANAKTGVYKIPVNKGVSYILGLTAKRAAGSNSRIFLSFDGINPMNIGKFGAPAGVIEPTASYKRYGVDFMTDDSGFVYLVIENTDGKLQIEDPTLFFAYYTNRNENKGTLKDPNFTFITHNGALKELWVPGSNDDSFAGTFDGVETPQSPETGSAPIWPICAVAFGFSVICLIALVIKKGGKRA